MWTEALRVAIIGFTVVFATLLILAISVKIMSLLCNYMGAKKGK